MPRFPPVSKRVDGTVNFSDSYPNVGLVFLQQLCGFEYTSKLQRMFQDMNVSRDLNDHFKKHLAATEPLDSKFLHCLMSNISSHKHRNSPKFLCTVNAD